MKSNFSLKLSPAFVVAFIAIRHLFHELHEMMHMVLGRYLCGVWGTRDFNTVHPISTDCAKSIGPLIGLEGPLFNYVAIWVGAILIITAERTKTLSWGIVLIFASLPGARLFTALVGGGDELGVAKELVHSQIAARVIVCVVIFAIIYYPLTLVYKQLAIRNRSWYFWGFLFLPMIIEGIVVLQFFNYLLKMGIGNKVVFMGMPQIACAILLADVIILIFFIKNIGGILVKANSTAGENLQARH